MSDGPIYDDQKPPPSEAVDHGARPRGGSTKKTLAALLALFLIAGVGVISYLAGRASEQEPAGSERATLREARQVPAPLPITLPPPASPPPPEVEPPPPVARMLEARSRNAAGVAKRRVEKQAVIPAIRERPPPRVADFRPPRRVRAARRALAQPQRVLHASSVVQLGEYPNRRQAEAAHARLVRVYPYLKTLPRSVKSVPAPSGNARAYHLRLKAYSPDHARILCQNLLSIGRGCAVLPEPA